MSFRTYVFGFALSLGLVASAQAQYCWVDSIEPDLQFLVAPVKAAGDIAKVDVNRSALRHLSAADRKRFVQSLTFNELGLTGYRYDVLEKLTVTQAYEVLGLFGAQNTIDIVKGARVETEFDKRIREHVESGSQLKCSGDGNLDGYRCESRATCTKTTKRVCMSTC